MPRQKKIKTVQTLENQPEVIMSDVAVLENLQTEIDLARVELEKTKLEIEERKKSMPLREIDEDERKIVDKQIARTNSDRSLQDKIAAQKAYDDVLITGRFMNRRSPGNLVKLTYMKYNTDPVKWYTFEDGKVYTIPRGFADQINEYYHTPQFTQKDDIMDPNSPCSVINSVDTSKKKYAFVPIGF